MFCRWTDVALLKTFLEAAMWEGKPLVKLSTEMKWFIEFSDVEIADLQKLYNLLEPMETLFTKLGSESLSTIQLVLPTLLVSRVFFVSKLMIIDCFYIFRKFSISWSPCVKMSMTVDLCSRTSFIASFITTLPTSSIPNKKASRVYFGQAATFLHSTKGFWIRRRAQCLLSRKY